MTHTPGPWSISMSDNATPHIYANDGDWRQKTKDLICVMPAELTQSFNSLNNARLIAAAPDLLEALESLLKMVEDGDWTTIELNEARQALAKATGDHQPTNHEERAR